MRFENACEVQEKADWEGGLVELIVDYGTTADELPLSFPQEVVDAWNRVAAIQVDVDFITAYLEAHVDDEEED
jgi:hypothetical protein